ncbi:MAG TPA: alpha/beta hydrolase [Oceanobacillus sp.]|nr:alpha/beta hydrolase [Oceanobacillus sp.]
MTQTGYVEMDGVYYETAGEGETLVLCHAGFVDSGMWDAQWEAFAQHYRVIRYDMRGYGKSDKATAPVSRRDELYRLLKHLGVERAHLLGCSMGGATAIDFTLEHPEMVMSLIAVSAVPDGFEMRGEPPPDLMEMIGAMQQGDLKRASELQIRIWVDGMFRQPEQVDPNVRQRAAEMNWIPVSSGTMALDMQPVNPLTPPAIERLSAIEVPMLVIVGALDHPEILRAADVMVSEVKRAKKVIIPDAAHVPNMEKPAEFNQAVLSFLKSVK